VPGEGRDAQPLTASHASGVNGGQTTGQTPQAGAPPSAARCGSCGGPSGGAELCPGCEQAFSAMLRNARPSAAAAPQPTVAQSTVAQPVAAQPAAAQPAVPQPAVPQPTVPQPGVPQSAAPQPAAPPTKPPEPAHVDASLWSQLMSTPPPPKSDAFELPPAAVSPVVIAVPPPPAPLPPVPGPTQPGASAAAIRAAQFAIAQAAKLEPIKLEEPRPGPPTAHGAAPPTPKHVVPERPIHEAAAAKAVRPAAPATPSKPSMFVGLLPSRTDRIAAALAVLFLLGMGTAGWIRYRDAQRDAALDKLLAAQEQEAAEAPAAVPEPAADPTPIETPPVIKPRKAVPPAAAPAPRKGAAATPVNVQPVRAVPSPSPQPPTVEVTSTARAAAPTGQVFQTTQVNEVPRVMWRVEPRLPAAVRDRNEVVVVRALVSQEGQPSRISLLRRSQSGPDVDDAVVDAVNQWTFVPAKKHGAPVSCWFNFAVTLGRPK
jgi:TonB family protein